MAITLNEQAQRFLNYKLAKELLKNKTMTDFHISRLNKLFEQRTSRSMFDWTETICKFILYDLNNYEGRMRRLKVVKNSSDYAYFLRYGRKMFKIIKEEHNGRKVKHFKNIISHWTEQGYSTEEAMDKVKEIQKANSEKSVLVTKGTNLHSVRALVYWLNKGYTEEEAKIEVKRVNTTNGLDFYVKKYGEELGEELYQQRLNGWLEVMNSKPEEEKELINKKKGPSIEGNMARGLTLEEATEKYNEHCEKMRNKENQSFSDISQDLFKRLEVSLKGSVFYQTKNYEYNISGFRVDFYHRESKTVIEFYGDFFHRNPEMFDADYTCYGKKSTEIWEYDSKREVVIKDHSVVDQLLIIWESEYRKNPVESVNYLLSKIGLQHVC